MERKPSTSKKLPAKPILPSQEVCTAWEKEDPAYISRKNCRAKKVLNRSFLKRSILTNEILRRKY